MRYVIVGTGNISNTYVAALANLPECELVGAVSRSGRALSAAPDMPVWGALAEVELPFDAVILATPNGLHHRGAIEAAQLGKHVLTEKPLDISLESMNQMTDACDRAGVTLAVCYQRRTRPDNKAVKRLMDDGAFGKVYAADLVAKFYRDQSYYDSGDYRGGYSLDGGGPFMQQACHNLDIYAWLFGMPVRVVSMLGTFAHDMEAEDHGAALMRHSNGMIGTVVASTIAKPGFAARLDVHTEKGSITLTDDVITHWSIEGVDNPSQPGDDYQHDGATSAAVTDTSAHEAIIKDFESAVSEKREPLAGAASSRVTTELILQIYHGVVRD